MGFIKDNAGACSCRNAAAMARREPAGLGFLPVTPAPAFPDWKTWALIALGALLIYRLFFTQADRERRGARAAARDKYGRELQRIEKRFGR